MIDLTLPVTELRATFDLGDWRRVELLPGGKSQHHLVATTRGRFVLRRSHRSKDRDEVRFEHELVAYLRAKGYPAPEFIPTVEGEPCAVVDGHLWRTSVFVAGRPARIADAAEAEAVARALARYHDLAAGFTASVPVPAAPLIPEVLRQRLEAVAVLVEGGAPNDDPLAFVVAEADAVASRLEHLYAHLPFTTIHAGCRRGSTLFREDRLVVVLDFDSAHREVRALDVAIAVFDFAKLYGDPTSPDYKVHLDPEVATRFVAAYHGVAPLEPAEVEAVPLLVVARRLRRALGRYVRLLAGEPLSDNDRKKIAMELARVRSLSLALPT